MKLKTWDQLTPPQKTDTMRLALAAGIPAPNLATGVYHTRGDFVAGASWEFMTAWGMWVGAQLEDYVMIAAKTLDGARKLAHKTYGPWVGADTDQLFMVAGVTEECVLKLIQY